MVVDSVRKITTKAGLQIKMTVYVTSAVLAVSAIILTVMAQLIRKDYGDFLDERISVDLTAITQNIEQRMLRVEDATNTMAIIASPLLGNDRDIDSLLCRSVRAIDGLQGISIIFREGYLPGTAGYFERYACIDDNHSICLESYENGDEVDSSYYWQKCFGEGRTLWTEATNELISGLDIVCYVVPLYDSDKERVGVVYSWIALNYLTAFVTKYKVRKDIDISVYSDRGTELVAPDDYILEVPPEDLISRECGIGHFGWIVRLSADREIIDKEVREALLSLAILIFVMFIVITLAIIITVKHVAEPFVIQQRQTEKEKAVIDNELQLAAAAQNELVPHVFPPFPSRKGIDLSACLHPARNVGGDLYDYFLLGNKLYFCIGDVSGKGLQASLFMAATHYLFRSVVAGMPAGDAISHMNVSLCTDNEKCRFVTFWFGCLDLGSGELEYVNAGHDAPVFLHDGRVESFPPSENMPLGVCDDAEYLSNTTLLEPGDILLLYTDGITEAMDANGREFGRQNLFDAVGSSDASDASSIIECILKQVRRHASGTVQSDDITMLCLRFITTETK